MIVLNFLFVFVFACISEFLRKNYFNFKNMFTSIKYNEVLKESAQPKEESVEEILNNASENVQVLYTMQIDYENAMNKIQEEKKESEKFNNQDQYAKFAKIQRSILKLEKITETRKLKSIFTYILSLKTKERSLRSI